MDQSILKSKDTVVTRQTLQILQMSELFCESDKMKHKLFDDIIEKKLGSSKSYL